LTNQSKLNPINPVTLEFKSTTNSINRMPDTLNIEKTKILEELDLLKAKVQKP